MKKETKLRHLSRPGCLAICAFALAACNGGGGGGGGGGGSVTLPARTISDAQILSSGNSFARLSALPATTNLPTAGSIAYNGLVTVADVADDVEIAGRVRMNMNFGTANISGNLTDVNLAFDQGTPQGLTGSSTVTGSIVGSQIRATTSGTFSGVDPDTGRNGAGALDLDLSGFLRGNGAAGPSGANGTARGNVEITVGSDVTNYGLDGLFEVSR